MHQEVSTSSASVRFVKIDIAQGSCRSAGHSSPLMHNAQEPGWIWSLFPVDLHRAPQLSDISSCRFQGRVRASVSRASTQDEDQQQGRRGLYLPGRHLDQVSVGEQSMVLVSYLLKYLLDFIEWEHAPADLVYDPSLSEGMYVSKIL